MVPLAGLPIYWKLRRLNGWTAAFLPNAADAPRLSARRTPHRRPVRAMFEAALRTPAGDRIERWEMERKVRKLSSNGRRADEVSLCADWCKGHFEGHGQHTLAAFHARMRALDEVLA